MSQSRIPAAVRRRVSERFGYRCAYCRNAEFVAGVRFQIDHIVPESRGGSNEESNLCLSCSDCNNHKYARTEADDPATGATMPLFHPTEQEWGEHFRWSDDGMRIVGTTPAGRATVEAMRLNRVLLLTNRLWATRAGMHPPRE